MDHPLLLPPLIAQEPATFTLKRLAYLISTPFLVVYRLLVISVTMVALYLYCIFANCFTNTVFELPSSKYLKFTSVTSLCYKIMLGALHIKVETFGQREAGIFAANHSSGLDIPALMSVGLNCMFLDHKPSFLNPVLRMARCFWPERGVRVQDEVRRRLIEGTWPELVIFPMGTFVRQGVVINFRNSLLPPACKIEPLTIECDVSSTQLQLSGEFTRVLHLLTGKGGHIRITFHQPIDLSIEGNQNDHALSLKEAFVNAGFSHIECSYRDLLWFRGKLKAVKLGEMYVEHFGWIGRYSDYKKMCQERGLDSRYYWSHYMLI